MKHQLKQGYIVQKQGDKTTLFDGEKSILYTLNDSASFMFEQIKNGLDEDKIVKNIVKKYKISPEDAKADFNTLLKNLKKKKIIL